MILWEVALPGKIQSRCDGVGSEVNGGKPSVNRALRGTLRGVCFSWQACFGGIGPSGTRLASGDRHVAVAEAPCHGGAEPHLDADIGPPQARTNVAAGD